MNFSKKGASIVGHTALMAGWYPLPGDADCVIQLGTNGTDARDVYRIAQDFLELSDSQANKLFYSDNWPEGFVEAKPITWKIAADRLLHFIYNCE